MRNTILGVDGTIVAVDAPNARFTVQLDNGTLHRNVQFTFFGYDDLPAAAAAPAVVMPGNAAPAAAPAAVVPDNAAPAAVVPADAAPVAAVVPENPAPAPAPAAAVPVAAPALPEVGYAQDFDRKHLLGADNAADHAQALGGPPRPAHHLFAEQHLIALVRGWVAAHAAELDVDGQEATMELEVTKAALDARDVEVAAPDPKKGWRVVRGMFATLPVRIRFRAIGGQPMRIVLYHVVANT